MGHRVNIGRDFLARINSFDGTPMIDVPEDYQSWLKAEFLPNFHICALGPVPLGMSDRIHLQIDNLMVKTYELAERVMWEYIEHICEQASFPFNSEEWDIVHVHLCNGH